MDKSFWEGNWELILQDLLEPINPDLNQNLVKVKEDKIDLVEEVHIEKEKEFHQNIKSSLVIYHLKLMNMMSKITLMNVVKLSR